MGVEARMHGRIVRGHDLRGGGRHTTRRSRKQPSRPEEVSYKFVEAVEKIMGKRRFVCCLISGMAFVAISGKCDTRHSGTLL